MNVIAYTALHYGRDYLASAIRSVIDYVDTYYVLYTPVGSHGHRSEIPCPETEDELYAIAAEAAGSKLRWHRGIWPYEGAQREFIYELAPDDSLILVLDSDEVWPAGLVEDVILMSQFNERNFIRVPMIHYWRSFHRAVLHDPAYPVRALCTWIPDESEKTITADNGYINHMGYAQRSEIVEYKQHVHGHKGEWRRDVDWFNDVFMANRQHDCHPVGSEYWNTETVNPLDYMPSWMAEHPYYPLDVIP